VRSFLVNLALVFVSLFVFGVVLEVGARLFSKSDSPGIGKPGVRMEGVNRQVAVDGILYESNNLGLRMPYDFDPTNSHNGKRVLVLGDSYAFGSGLPYSDLVSVKMESLLGKDFPGIELINAAVSGSNTWDQYQQLLRVGRVVKPNLVIVFFYTNDLDHNASSNWRLEIIHALMRNSRFFQATYHGYKRVVAPRIGIPRMWVPKHYVELNDSNPGWVRFKEATLGIREECAERGAEFLLVIIPSLVNLDENYPFSELREKLRMFMQQESIGLVDLFEVYAEHEPSDLWLNPTDPHWNGFATTLAAERVSAFVSEEMLLTEGAHASGVKHPK